LTARIEIAETPELLHLFGEMLSEYEAALPLQLQHPDMDEELASLAERYSMPNAAFLALLGDTPCGCVGLRARDGDTAVVRHLYVNPSYRGLGVARALMQALLDCAKARGFQNVVLDTHAESLPAAYQLYQSLGFKECAPYGSVDYVCPTFMELRL
jgi:GNAT superfamily N-acetyltransferase